jgi:Cu-processing system permease protein
MRQKVRNIGLIAWTLMLEAWRRREIYVIVFVTTAFLIGLRFVHFFGMEGLGKFYREVSLKTMNVITAITVILLAARQLPREFSSRTIYPLLAKPVTRLEFLLGKFVGVLAAGVFCYALFMIVFGIGSVTLRAPVHSILFAQSVYLQVLSLAVVCGMVLFLSMAMHSDAAATLALVLFLASQILMNLMSTVYDYSTGAARAVLLALHFIIPQLTLFDASSKVIHSMKGAEIVWGALPAWAMWELTAYAAVYVLLFLSGAFLLFRRRPL